MTSKFTPIEGVPRVFGVPEIARHCGTTDGAIYGAIARGELRAIKVGRLVRVTEEALTEYLVGEREAVA